MEALSESCGEHKTWARGRLVENVSPQIIQSTSVSSDSELTTQGHRPSYNSDNCKHILSPVEYTKREPTFFSRCTAPTDRPQHVKQCLA